MRPDLATMRRRACIANWNEARPRHDAAPGVLLRADGAVASGELPSWRGPITVDAWAFAAESTARAVKQCHDAGLVHRDLNLGNILAVRSPRPGRPSADIFEEEMLVIDLDRSRMKPRGLADRERLTGLCRLARSHEKTFGRSGPWGPDPIRSLIPAYASGDSSLEGRLRAMLPRQERSMRLHRLGWWLSRGR